MKKSYFLILASGLFCLLVYLAYRETKLVLQTTVTAWTEEHEADCGVVLTGGQGRFREGVNLLYLNKIKKLIISGVNADSYLEEIFPNMIFYGDINTNDIVLEKVSGTTFGNAHQSLPLVEALQCSTIVLITSKLHMYRAYRTFRQHYPAHIEIKQRATVGHSYQPHTEYVVTEVVKSLFYRLIFY